MAIHRIRITLTSRNVKSLEKGQYGALGGWFSGALRRSAVGDEEMPSTLN